MLLATPSLQFAFWRFSYWQFPRHSAPRLQRPVLHCTCPQKSWTPKSLSKTYRKDVISLAMGMILSSKPRSTMDKHDVGGQHVQSEYNWAYLVEFLQEASDRGHVSAILCTRRVIHSVKARARTSAVRFCYSKKQLTLATPVLCISCQAFMYVTAVFHRAMVTQ